MLKLTASKFTVKNIKGLSIFKNVASKDELRYNLNGVLVDNGNLVATNGHILSIVPDFLGLSNINGKIIKYECLALPEFNADAFIYHNAKGVPYTQILPNVENECGYENVDLIKLVGVVATANKLNKVAKNDTNSPISFLYNGLKFGGVEMYNLVECLILSGSKFATFYPFAPDKAMFLKTDNGSMGLIMPLRPDVEQLDFLPIEFSDLIYTDTPTAKKSTNTEKPNLSIIGSELKAVYSTIPESRGSEGDYTYSAKQKLSYVIDVCKDCKNVEVNIISDNGTFLTVTHTNGKGSFLIDDFEAAILRPYLSDICLFYGAKFEYFNTSFEQYQQRAIVPKVAEKKTKTVRRKAAKKVVEIIPTPAPEKIYIDVPPELKTVECYDNLDVQINIELPIEPSTVTTKDGISIEGFMFVDSSGLLQVYPPIEKETSEERVMNSFTQRFEKLGLQLNWSLSNYSCGVIKDGVLIDRCNVDNSEQLYDWINEFIHDYKPERINPDIASQDELMDIDIISYNIQGQKLRSGKIKFDIENSIIITNSGKKLSVINDYEWTYKLNKKTKTIKASGGINGLLKFINEMNTPKSAFNPCYTDVFIEM